MLPGVSAGFVLVCFFCLVGLRLGWGWRGGACWFCLGLLWE